MNAVPAGTNEKMEFPSIFSFNYFSTLDDFKIDVIITINSLQSLKRISEISL